MHFTDIVHHNMFHIEKVSSIVHLQGHAKKFDTENEMRFNELFYL